MAKLCCPYLHSFGHTPRPPASRTVTICPRGRSGIECRPVQRVQRPGVRVLPWYLPALVFWRGLPCCLYRVAVPGALGLGSPPAGYTGSAGGGVGHARDKIFQRKRRFSWVVSQTTHPTLTNQTPSDCASLQKFRKKQKDPLRSH